MTMDGMIIDDGFSQERKDRPDLKSDQPNIQREKRNSCDLGPDRKKEQIICFYFFLLLCWVP